MLVKHVIARKVLSRTKQQPAWFAMNCQAIQKPRAVQVFHGQLLLLASLCSFLLFACGPQGTVNSLPQIPQKSLSKNSPVQAATSTSTPETVFVHDSVTLVYALVAPFPTLTDGVSFEELKRAWVDGIAPAPFSGHPLLMTES